MAQVIAVGILIVALVVLSVCITGGIVMLIWNALAVYFGFKVITFGVGILISLALGIIGSYFKSTIKKESK